MSAEEEVSGLALLKEALAAIVADGALPAQPPHPRDRRNRKRVKPQPVHSHQMFEHEGVEATEKALVNMEARLRVAMREQLRSTEDRIATSILEPVIQMMIFLVGVQCCVCWYAYQYFKKQLAACAIHVWSHAQPGPGAAAPHMAH